MFVISGGSPDGHIPVSNHDVNHGKLMPEHILVALAVHELQTGASTPDIVAISRTIAIMPVPVLV